MGKSMGFLSDDQLSAFVEHLEGCPLCQARLTRRMQVDAAHEESLACAVAHALEVAPCVAAQRDAAPARFAELLELPASGFFATVAVEPRFQTYSLANYVLERSERDVSHNPMLALVMARLARAITVRIDPRTCGGMEALADLGAYSLAMEGNVQRVCGRWPSALVAFARAREVQKRGGSDPDLMAKIDLMEASLLRDLRQIREALSLLDRAENAFLVLGDRERCLWTQINRANVSLVQGKPDGATAILEKLLGTTNDPQITLVIRHNLAWALAQAGQAREAARLHEETRDLCLRFSDPLNMSRRLWLEGVVAGGLGQDRRARSLLQKASDNLSERGYAFDAALARLDLAKVQARRSGEPLHTC